MPVSPFQHDSVTPLGVPCAMCGAVVGTWIHQPAVYDFKGIVSPTRNLCPPCWTKVDRADRCPTCGGTGSVQRG